MHNFKQDVLEEAGKEPIEAVVIGDYCGYKDHYKTCPTDDRDAKGRILSWEEAAPVLDYACDTGFGGAECHAIYAWTATRVLFVAEYDGSTRMISVPRNPVDCIPRMS